LRWDERAQDLEVVGSIWTRQEDEILKELYEQRGVKKWSELSRVMERDYGIEGRNGKQCR
jgi:hypothetical protein